MCVNHLCYVATQNLHCCLHDGIRFPLTTCCVYVFYRTVTNNCIVIVFAANEEYYQLLMINDSQPSGLDVSSYTIEEIDSITSEYTLKNNVSSFEIVQTFYFLCVFFVAVYTEERRCSPAFKQLSNVWSDSLDSLCLCEFFLIHLTLWILFPLQDIFAVAVSLITGRIVYISDQAASILNCKRDVFKNTKFVEFLTPQDVSVFYSFTTPYRLPSWSVCTGAGTKTLGGCSI